MKRGSSHQNSKTKYKGWHWRCLLLLAGQPLFVLVSGGRKRQKSNGIHGNTKRTYIKFPVKCHWVRRSAHAAGDGRRRYRQEQAGGGVGEARWWEGWVGGWRAQNKRKGKQPGNEESSEKGWFAKQDGQSEDEARKSPWTHWRYTAGKRSKH